MAREVSVPGGRTAQTRGNHLEPPNGCRRSTCRCRPRCFDLDLVYPFIGHDLTVVAHVTDRLGVMYLGKLMELGPTDDVMVRPAHPYTIALRSAEPETVPVAMRSRTRIVLEGDIPSPIAPPSGCVFHTRCPDAQPSCATDVPDWRPLGPDRWIACHFPRIEPTTPEGAHE